MTETAGLGNIIFFALIIGTEVLTGIILTIRRIKSKTKNLEFLAGYCIGAAVVTVLFSIESASLLRDVAFIISIFLAQYLLLVFANRMFFVGKKSPFLIFFLTLLGGTIAYLISIALYPAPRLWQMSFINSIPIGIVISIPGFWFGPLIIKQYKKIKNEEIETWIKMRFLIAGIGAILEGTIGWLGFLIATSDIPGVDPTGILYTLTLLLYAVILIVFSIGFFIAWVMPNSMKRFFNRNYIAPEESELSEEDIMMQMKGGE
ncbi:MAG: hypothetical protein ACFFAS_13550 [Promethearchaeota archaeon]